MNQPTDTLSIKELSEILRRSPTTIATDVTRAPQKLPPRLKLPGSRRVLWLRSDVEEWLKKHRELV